MTPHWISFEVKVDIHIFAKSTRIIISVGFRIAKCLQYNIWFNEDIFNPVKKTLSCKKLFHKRNERLILNNSILLDNLNLSHNILVAMINRQQLARHQYNPNVVRLCQSLGLLHIQMFFSHSTKQNLWI